jgi:hypothetical protein
MVRAIRQQVTVQAGGRVEIPVSDLPAGARAEVVVTLKPSAEPRQSLHDMIGQARGCYPTPQDADRFIRQERDSWES